MFAPRPASSERRLMLAVLRAGIRTLLYSVGRTPTCISRQRREDLHWLMSGDRREVFAYENICDVLGIDAAHLRRHVLQLSGLNVPSQEPEHASTQPPLAAC